METLSPSEHLQAPVEVGLPWRSGSPFAKVVQPLLQLYYLHAFGTGGSIDSLATRCPLSTFQPKDVDGVVFAVCLCRVVSRSCSDIGLLQYVHANHLQQAVADRGVSGPWGPQFCGALCNGETQRLPAGGAGTPGGVRGRAPEANTFWQQYRAY